MNQAGPDLVSVSREELERLRAISRAATTLVHDINQPLTAAIAYLRAAQRFTGAAPKDASARMAETLDKTATQILRAGQVVQALSEFVAHGKSEERR
ncbi:MAG: histidine kinase dimerization/phospho-acceptor domain-containing protein [Methylocystis sp.]|uniref:histidine kinase dimerization/phospho-acceptor domain-containing protein n=1 Tax=Methylocystis sp. TaxID=1911079 RepID=UPI003D0E5633